MPVEEEMLWNLEETQERVLDELKNILSSGKVDTKTLQTISKNVAVLAKDSKTVNEMNNQLKTVASATTGSAKSNEALTKQFKKESTNRRKDNIALRKDMSDSRAVKNLQSFDQGIGNTLDDLDAFSGTLKGTAKLLGIGGAFGAIIGIIGNQIDSYRGLINVGQGFGGSMMEMSHRAANAGISLKMMSDVAMKHGALMANVGIKTVMDNQKAVRGLINQYGNFGLSLEQIQEFNASEMESRKLQGMFDKLSDGERAQRTAIYLKNLTELSKVTGKRREELDKDMKKQRESMDAYAAAAFFNSKSQGQAFLEANNRMAATAVRMGKTGDEMMQGIYLGIDKGTIAVNDQMRAMLSKEGPIGNAARALDRAVASKNIPMIEKAQQAFANAMLKESSANELRLRRRGAFQKETQQLEEDRRRMRAQDGKEASEAAKALTDSLSDTTARLNGSSKALLNFDSNIAIAWGALRDSFIVLLGPIIEQTVVAFANLFSILSEEIPAAWNWLNDNAFAPLGSMITGVLEKFGLLDEATGALKWVYDRLGIGIAAVITAFAGFKIIKGVLGMFGIGGGGKSANTKALNTLTRAIQNSGGFGGGGGDGMGRDGKTKKQRFSRTRRAGRGVKGFLGRAVGKVGGLVGGGGNIAGKLAGGAGNLLKGAGKFAGMAGRLAGKAFAPLAVLMAVGDAVQGYQKAGENFKLKKGEEATAGQKASSAAGGVVSGLTMGLVDEGAASRWIGSLFGAGKDTAKEKEKEKIESVAKVADGDQTVGTPTEQLAKQTALMETMAEELKLSRETMAKMQADTQSTARSTKKSEPSVYDGQYLGGP